MPKAHFRPLIPASIPGRRGDDGPPPGGCGGACERGAGGRHPGTGAQLPRRLGLGGGSGRAGALPRRHRPRRHRGRQHAVHGGPHPGGAAGPGGAAHVLRRHGRLHLGERDRPADPAGRLHHGRRAERPHLPAQAAAAEEHQAPVGQRAAGGAAQADSEDPALHSRHGPGCPGLLPDPAVLAGGVGGEHRQPGAVPGRPLRRRSARGAARRGAGEGAGGLPGCRPLPPGHAGPDRRADGTPAGAGGRGGDRRSPADALLRAGGRHPALRRRHPILRGAGAARRALFRLRARFAAGDRGLLHEGRPQHRRRRRVADGLFAGRWPGLQRRARRRGDADPTRRAVCRRPCGGVPVARPVARLGTRAAAGRIDDHGRDSGTGRRDRADGVRRPRRRSDRRRLGARDAR